MSDWYTHCYSRLLIDNHISEDDPAAMTRFDPERYVAMVKKAGVESAMVYATCHNGNCYYPSKVGHQHKSLGGRDIFGEVVRLLRKENIVPVAYYTSIYHNHAAKAHPSWRITLATGAQHDGRYWWSCPSNPEYREFVKAQIGEVIAYDVAGIFNDMTFWPGICICASCRERFLRETGWEIPTTIDWSDKRWVAFQRFRENVMADFSQDITASIRSQRDISVTHQTSTIQLGWVWGYSAGIAKACDYTSGDFYGGKYQHVLGCKLLAALSHKQPYEFMTSRSVNLRDHTSMKSLAELTAEAATTLANAGAYFFIDAINPDGTLEDDVYQRLGQVAQNLKPFTQAVKKHRPEMAADTAMYYSASAYVSGAESSAIMSPSSSIPSVEEASGTSVILTRNHRPFRAITNETENYHGLNTIILNNIRYTTEQENERLRTFVRAGGTLIATGLTSLYRPDGSTMGDFGLGDVFGITYAGKNSRRFHYLSFVDRRWLVAAYAPAPLASATTSRVLARINEPMFDPDSERYASIHSNPPGTLTEYVGLSVNTYGKGKCIYLASPVLALQQDAQQSFGAWLLREFVPSSIVQHTNAPHCVEITVNHSTTARAYVIGFVNYQKEQPNVPVHDIEALLKLPGVNTPKCCRRVSDGRELPVNLKDGCLHIEIPILTTLEMIEVEY